MSADYFYIATGSTLASKSAFSIIQLFFGSGADILRPMMMIIMVVIRIIYDYNYDYDYDDDDNY